MKCFLLTSIDNVICSTSRIATHNWLKVSQNKNRVVFMMLHECSMVYSVALPWPIMGGHSRFSHPGLVVLFMDGQHDDGTFQYSYTVLFHYKHAFRSRFILHL